VAINKLMNNPDEAVADIFDGATVGVSSFAMKIMSPEALLWAVARKGPKHLTVVAHGVGLNPKKIERPGVPFFVDHGLWIERGMVKKLISSFPFAQGLETPVSTEWKAGRLEVEHLPHGTLALRLWAAGAGVGGVYIKTGVGTEVDQGKEKRDIEGETYMLEWPLKLDFALIRAYKADRYGNLVYRGVGRCTSPIYARAAKIVIAEVDEVVEPGDLDPEDIVTPGIYVHRVVKRPAIVER